MKAALSCLYMSGNVWEATLAAFEQRLKTILPEMYQDCYEDVQPVSMGSASLQYNKDGSVNWGEMWNSFCDLAMAGGPPHKGTLLTPATKVEVEAQPDQYQAVVQEICRGITLVSDLDACSSEYSGWIRVQCSDALMAEWLVRAIVMENVSAHWKETALFLPAGPHYRIEKEIKNVVTVIAKTCHYWVDHMWLSQQREINKLFAALAAEGPLVQTFFPENEFSGDAAGSYELLHKAIHEKTGWKTISSHHGWIGVECPSVAMAIWIMRGMAVSNVLSRREGTTLFLPTAKQGSPAHEQIVQTLAQVHSFAQEKGIH